MVLRYEKWLLKLHFYSSVSAFPGILFIAGANEFQISDGCKSILVKSIETGLSGLWLPVASLRARFALLSDTRIYGRFYVIELNLVLSLAP